MDFNAKFEPKENKIIHGAGQSLEAFSNYWNAVEDYKPAMYMTYAKIPKIQKWIENPKVIPPELEQRNYEVVDRILLDYIKSLLNLEQVRA